MPELRIMTDRQEAHASLLSSRLTLSIALLLVAAAILLAMTPLLIGSVL